MSEVRNHITVVYDYDERLIEFRRKAIELFDPLVKQISTIKTDGEFVSPIINSLKNGEEYFIVNTDGSYVGWETNKEFQSVRKEFVDYCEANGVIQIATLEFGDNDRPRLTSY